MAVLSNKPDGPTKLAVSTLLPDHHFDVVYGERAPLPRKPNPAGALAIAEEIGVPPNRFVYLGDSDTDMQTANAAGMHAVGALWGFRPADELTANGAAELIEKPMDLLGLLDQK